jgi:hypothetical protein
MTSHQLKNPYGFFAPYIPIPKGRGFTALLVKITHQEERYQCFGV